MGQVYAIDIASTAVTTAVDILEITPAANRPCEIVAVFLFQTTELGDAAEEQLVIQIIRGFTTSGSGGNAAVARTPLKANSGAAAGFTAETMNTTVASVGTGLVLLTDGWNVRSPYLFQPIRSEDAPQATAGNTTMVLRSTVAPADSVTMRGCVWVEEF